MLSESVFSKKIMDIILHYFAKGCIILQTVALFCKRLHYFAKYSIVKYYYLIISTKKTNVQFYFDGLE